MENIKSSYPCPEVHPQKPLSQEELEQDVDVDAEADADSGTGADTNNDADNKSVIGDKCHKDDISINKKSVVEEVTKVVEEVTKESKTLAENAELDSALDDKQESEIVKIDTTEKKNTQITSWADGDEDMQIQIMKVTEVVNDVKRQDDKHCEYDNCSPNVRQRSWRKLKDNGEEKTGGIDEKDIDAYLERRRARSRDRSETVGGLHRNRK